MKKLFIYLIFGLFFGLKAMDVQTPYTKFIESKASDIRYQNPAFITFIKAKIKASADQLVREIPQLFRPDSTIYTHQEAIEIIQKSYALFAGDKKTNPVFGYLEVLEVLEKDLALNNLHCLAGRLYELERANALAQAGNSIIEFGAQIKIPAKQRAQLQAEKHAHLLMDIDIYALDANKNPILEEVKSYKYCSDQGEAELCELITGMQLLRDRCGITCRLQTKYALKKPMQRFCDDLQIAYGCDNPHTKMQRPVNKPNYQLRSLDEICLINKDDLNLIEGDDCIAFYPKVKESRKTFIRDLEHAHIAYIESFLPQITTHENLAETVRKNLPIAREKLSLIPGFLNPALTSLACSAENGNWDDFKSKAFELVCALDIPENKKIVALGAELFFNHTKNPLKGPAYRFDNGNYFRAEQELTGYDIDVLVQDSNNPELYTCIEATTGRSTVKDFTKFRAMGNGIEAEVFVLHNFFDNAGFTRTAYLKKPVIIQLASGLHLCALPWEIACQTNACLQALEHNGKNIYNPLTITLNKNFLSKFCESYKKLVSGKNEGISQRTNSVLSEKKLIETIKALLQTVHDVDNQADEASYKGRIQGRIAALITQEKQDRCIGSSALAVLLLKNLDCTIPRELKERYIPGNHRCSVDLNKALEKALDGAITQELAVTPHTGTHRTLALPIQQASAQELNA